MTIADTNDLERARCWAISAAAHAELALEELPYNDPQRHRLTGFLAAIRLDDITLVDEYRDSQHRDPQLTEAMTWAGRRAVARIVGGVCRQAAREPGR